MNDRLPTNHWGLWDAEEEHGVANFITDTAVFAAATLVRSGCAYSVSLPVQMNMGGVGSSLNSPAIA